MKLYVMRHGWAGDPSPDPKKERERPLLPEGKATVTAIAQAMMDLGEVPNSIFCSPFKRTTMTADLCGALFAVQVNIIGELSPVRPMENSIGDLISNDRLKRIMLVVHVDNSTPAMNTLGGNEDWKDLVMGQIRGVKIDRDSWKWKTRFDLKPSDLGLRDRKS